MLKMKTMKTVGLKLRRSAPSLSNEKVIKLMSRGIQVYNRSYLRNRLASPDLMKNIVQVDKRKHKDHCYLEREEIVECPILGEQMIPAAFNSLAMNTIAIMDDKIIILFVKKLVPGINLQFLPSVHRMPASEQVLDLICHLYLLVKLN